MSEAGVKNWKDDPLWARGFTRLLDIIIENTRRLGLTSTQIRALLALNLLAFRGQSTSYRRVAALTRTTPQGARRTIRNLAEAGLLELDEGGPVHEISTQPYLDKALELARTVGPRRQRPPVQNPDITFRWTADNLHFTRLPALLLEHPGIDLTATELHLLLVISYYTYGFSSYIYRDDIIRTSRADIADLMGVSERTVSRTLASLERKGYAIRTTIPGQGLSVDLSPLFNLIRRGGEAIANTPRGFQYTREVLDLMIAGSPFQSVPPEVIASLIKQYGTERVALTVDILSQEYAKRPITNPTRLLRAMVAKGITPDEGFIPWYARERMRKEAEELQRQGKHIANIKKMLEERTETEWKKLCEDERERWRGKVRAELEKVGLPITINAEEMAKYWFQQDVVFEMIADERGTPPERREKLRKILYG